MNRILCYKYVFSCWVNSWNIWWLTLNVIGSLFDPLQGAFKSTTVWHSNVSFNKMDIFLQVLLLQKFFLIIMTELFKLHTNIISDCLYDIGNWRCTIWLLLNECLIIFTMLTHWNYSTELKMFVADFPLS